MTYKVTVKIVLKVYICHQTVISNKNAYIVNLFTPLHVITIIILIYILTYFLPDLYLTNAHDSSLTLVLLKFNQPYAMYICNYTLMSTI